MVFQFQLVILGEHWGREVLGWHNWVELALNRRRGVGDGGVGRFALYLCSRNHIDAGPQLLPDTPEIAGMERERERIYENERICIPFTTIGLARLGLEIL